VRAALPAPRDDAGRRAAVTLLEAVYDQAVVAGPPSLDEIDGVLLVAGWFRRHAGERQRTLQPAEALEQGRTAHAAPKIGASRDFP
jgi:hypothetical protein